MPFIPQKVFLLLQVQYSVDLLLLHLSETFRNKWRHNDVISRHSDITVSEVIIISTYTMLCKFAGHNESGFKVTWGRGEGGALPGPRRSE